MGEARYLGVVADGRTDARVIEHIVMTLLGGDGPWECIAVQGSLRDDMDAFWRTSRQDQGPASIASESARNLRAAILGLLRTAHDRFVADVPRDLGHRDLLLVATDSERELPDNRSYLGQPWAAAVPRLFALAIEDFYQDHYARLHHPPCSLPLICSLVPFPSIDVLVAAAKEKQFRGIKARELKQALYNTPDLSSLADKEFESLALDPIDIDACVRVCQCVPEASMLLRHLAWNLGCPA